MRMSELLDANTLHALYYQTDQHGNQIRPTCLMMEGPPGIGKTDVANEYFPKILSSIFKETFGWWGFTVPEHEAQDMIGFLIPTKDKDGVPQSVYAYPPVMPNAKYLADHPRGIMFVDEANQGDMSMNKSLSALFLKGRMGTVQLPVGWWVVAASNRMEDRSGVMRPPMHNVNRQRIIQIEADIEALLDWQITHGMHPMGVGFTKQFPSVVLGDKVPSEPKPFCSPRSFASAMRFLQTLAGKDDKGHVNMVLPSSSLAQEAIAGDVGPGVAAQMFSYFKVVDQLPTFDEILKDPAGAKVPTFARMDAAYAAMQMCVYNATPGNIDKVWVYAERMPKALQVPAAKALLAKSGGALLNSKALGNWISKNQVLITNTLKA